MRDTTTFTIDPKDAKDFDDAISYKELEGGDVEIGIHIADVSYFVRPGDPIDKEAHKRATSIYLVDRTIPMLPEILSNDLCSLRPDVDRLAMSAIFTMSKAGEVKDVWFGETVIHSDKRFTYEDAQEVLEKKDGPFLKELEACSHIAQILRKSRQEKGAVSFDAPEVKVEIDETGTPVRIYLKERKETNLLIEDLMLLANEAVAARMQKVTKENGESFIYRIHDLPDSDRIQNLASFLKALGYTLPTDHPVTGRDLNALFKKIEGTPEEFLIKTSAIRSMAKAEYTTHNIGHFGLAMSTYTHFTSPIRRYPDLLVHRLLKAHLHHTPWKKHELAALEEDARHSTEREIAASEAERDSIKLKQVEWMAGKIGQSFDGVISGVSDRGLFITESTTRSDGFIAIRNIGSDFYTYDERNYQLVGSRSGEAYRLGDTVKVRLVKADTVERLLDFVLEK
jgi:ribonuclease R